MSGWEGRRGFPTSNLRPLSNRLQNPRAVDEPESPCRRPVDPRRLRRGVTFWTGNLVPTGPAYAVHSARYRVASVASCLPILAFFPQERFRIPVIDPALIVSAALLAGPRERT